MWSPDQTCRTNATEHRINLMAEHGSVNLCVVLGSRVPLGDAGRWMSAPGVKLGGPWS